MARIRGNTVILKGDPLQDTSRVREYVDAKGGVPAVGAGDKTYIYPGMLIEYDGSFDDKKPTSSAIGKFRGDKPFGTAKGAWRGSIADIRDYIGDGLSIPYTDGDTMQVFYPYPGCVLRGLFASPNAETTLKKDAALVPDALGGLQLAAAVGSSNTATTEFPLVRENMNIVGYVHEEVVIAADAFDLKAIMGSSTQNYVYFAWRVK